MQDSLNPKPEGIASLYVHFPFCEVKCHYCDFYSLAAARTPKNAPRAFEEALRLEALLTAEWLAPSGLETIFFGGGTPSMTDPESMERALAPLFEKTALTPTTEWTMEANPSSIDLARLDRYRSLGVNRISMGVQSVQDRLLALLGRVHDESRVFSALDEVFLAGFENVSVDLLCGVPGQRLQDIEEALQALTRYPITHLSCYLLTLPKHHRLFADLPSEDGQLEHLLFVDQWMTANGFEHYEISNYCRPGREARHNLRYWRGDSYLGLGPSAHSFDATTSRRWKNISSIHQYGLRLKEGALPVEWVESLSPDQKELEKWLLGLRLAEGIPLTWLDTDRRQARASLYREMGLIENHPRQDGRIRLTAKGFALSDQVIQDLCR